MRADRHRRRDRRADGRAHDAPRPRRQRRAAPADLPVDELRAATHLHLSGYTLLDPGSRAAGLVALEHAREAGVSVSVDPASAAPLAGGRARAFLDWVAAADVLLPNLEEAVVLTGARDPEAAAWALARDGREVVITLGAGGALWSDGEQVVRAAAAGAPAPSTRPAPATRSRPAGSPRASTAPSPPRRLRRQRARGARARRPARARSLTATGRGCPANDTQRRKLALTAVAVRKR